MSDTPTDPREPLVSDSFASAEQIGPVVEKVEAALAGVTRPHALMALFSIILLIQHPGITPDQMFEGVRDVSRYTCLWLSGQQPDFAADPESFTSNSKLTLN